MQTPLLNIGPYLYQPKHQIDETKMSTLWVALEQHHTATRPNPGRSPDHSPGQAEERVVLKIARMSDTKYSLTNQRAIENEEKWLSALRHPNIVHLRPIAESQPSRQQIYRARSELPGNPWFLVTDFLSGGDLSSVLAERRKLPASLALEITERVADALAYLHAHNCVHCDIKPRNILFRRKPEGYALSHDTQPIVIDFGIAKNPTEGRQLVSGTPRWITPEMAQAMSVGTRLEVDPSWDVYALGLVLYNAITGRKPKLDQPGSESWETVKPADLAGDPSVTNAKALAEGLNVLLIGATADDHRQRLSAEALLSQVQRLQNHVRVPAGGRGATVRVDSRSSRSESRSDTHSSAPGSAQGSRGRGWGLALGGAAAAVGLGAVLWFGGFLPGAQQGAGAVPVAEIAQATGQTPAGTTNDSAGETSGATTGGETNSSQLAAGEAGGGAPPAGNEPDEPAPAEPLGGAAGAAAAPEQAVDPSATATASPVPPTPTRAPATPTPAVVAAGRNLTPTSTPVAPTSTPIKTSTRLPTPTRTRVPTSTPTPVTSTPTPVRATPTSETGSSITPNLSAALTQPSDGASGNGRTIFTWQPDGTVGANDCFELRFWEDSPTNWANGFGLASHTHNTQITVDLNETLANEIGNNRLRHGITYYWGVLHVPCNPYQPPQRLASNVHRFTYQAP